MKRRKQAEAAMTAFDGILSLDARLEDVLTRIIADFPDADGHRVDLIRQAFRAIELPEPKNFAPMALFGRAQLFWQPCVY